jgi:hypothetical protein
LRIPIVPFNPLFVVQFTGFLFRNTGFPRIKYGAGLIKPGMASKESRPQGRALTPKFLNPRKGSRNKFGMTKRPEQNRHVVLNLFQHLVCFFLPSSDAPFIPVHTIGFSGAILLKKAEEREEVGAQDHTTLQINPFRYSPSGWHMLMG